MTTDITVYQPPSNAWVDLLAPTVELAGKIATTEFVPAALKGKPAAVTACILFGSELGLGPMQSLAKIDIIGGRAAPRAELARALALAAGHEVWVDKSTNTAVTVCGRRKGSEHVQTVTWTMDDVRAAGLANNPNYKKYPRQMLLARASAELVRAMAPDVLGGIGVFAEESDDVEPTPETQKAEVATKRRTAKAAIEPPPPPPLPDEEPPIVDAEVVDERGPSEAQMRLMMALFRDHGLSDKADRLAFCESVCGRTFTTSKEMTQAEVSAVIDALQATPSAPPEEFVLEVPGDES